jgi:hypothetical protein
VRIRCEVSARSVAQAGCLRFYEPPFVKTRCENIFAFSFYSISCRPDNKKSLWLLTVDSCDAAQPHRNY